MPSDPEEEELPGDPEPEVPPPILTYAEMTEQQLEVAQERVVQRAMKNSALEDLARRFAEGQN